METFKEDQYEMERFDPILEIILKLPMKPASAFDIGGRSQYLRRFFKDYSSLDLQGSKHNQDLNKNPRINEKNKSADIVIASQILEHITFPEEIVKEIKRISRKYVLIGLPNEYPLYQRLRILLGRGSCGVDPYGHKHRFNLKTINSFVKRNFPEYKKIFTYNHYSFFGGRLTPKKIRHVLIKLLPSLFVGERYILLENENTSNKK